MPGRDLPARLEQQNERVQALEAKIKRLEDREKDGKYLAELEQQLKVEKNGQRKIANIYSLSEMEIAEIKTKAKALALVAYQTGDYEIYQNYMLIAKSNEEGLIEVTEEYQQSLLDVIPEAYLELQAVDPKELEERSKEAGKIDLEEEKEKEEKEETTNKLQEDTGLELVSLVRIEDENFSRDVIGRETGYAEQYIGITKDGSICLVGLRPDNKFEVNPEFVGARTATTNEQPGECGKSSVDMVVPRKDGTTSSLGIDINYGQITLTNRNTNEPIETSNYQPSNIDIEKHKLEEEKGARDKTMEEMQAEKKKQQEQKAPEKAKEDEDDGHGWPGERTLYKEDE